MQIEKFSFEIPIFVTHLESHDELKKELLPVIRDIQANQIKTPGSPISQSSYGQGELNRKWHPIFRKHTTAHLTALYNELKTPQWDIHQLWFQTYGTGDRHRIHTHGGYTWANVYYIDLPNPELGTAFYHPMLHWVELRGHRESDSPPVIRPEVKEGDVVTFPGYLEHEAPLVGVSQSKTIISFNVQKKG